MNGTQRLILFRELFSQINQSTKRSPFPFPSSAGENKNFVAIQFDEMLRQKLKVRSNGMQHSFVKSASDVASYLNTQHKYLFKMSIKEVTEEVYLSLSPFRFSRIRIIMDGFNRNKFR